MKSFYLIGFRGAGKTTLGQKLAAELGFDFVDLDQVWEERRGISIVDFVARNGVDAFRAEEEQLLAEFERDPRTLVIATGGGIVEWPFSRELLERSRRPKIYLELDAKTLWQRLENSPERKKIGDLENMGRLAALLEKRRPFYEKIATFRVENRAITESLARIKKFLTDV